MASLEYSQTVRKKLKNLKIKLTQNYGRPKAEKIIANIVNGIRRLEEFPQSGIPISSQYDVKCDYSYIFIEHNYFFYRMKNSNTILILEMFHEKEDFMSRLFGVVTTSKETLDYWGE